jgi:hypothetical protein
MYLLLFGDGREDARVADWKCDDVKKDVIKLFHKS